MVQNKWLCVRLDTPCINVTSKPSLPLFADWPRVVCFALRFSWAKLASGHRLLTKGCSENFTMADVSSYRIEVAADPANPGYHRWAISQNGQQLDLPGYAYASAWSAEEAARTALRWHLILNPLRSQPDMGSCPSLRSSVVLPRGSGKFNLTGLKRLLLSKPATAYPSQT